MKTVFFSTLFFVSFFSFSISQSQETTLSFFSPEAAIRHYFIGITNNDFDSLMQASAIQEMSQGFNLDVSAERLGDMIFPNTSLAPSSYPFYVEVNKAQLSAELMTRVKTFSFSLLSGLPVTASPIPLDAEASGNFIEAVNPERLSSIVIQKISHPAEALLSNERYLETIKANASIYSADELTERVVLFSFEDKTYYLGFTLLRFGTGWKISAQISPLANTDSLGTAQELSPEDFEALINSN